MNFLLTARNVSFQQVKDEIDAGSFMGEERGQDMNTDYVPENASLDADEQWYEDHLEEFVPDDPRDRASLMEAAKKPPVILGERKQMVSIRLDQADLRVLKEKAERAGIGYKTMVSALLHQYAIGDLVNVEEARKLFRKPGSVR